MTPYVQDIFLGMALHSMQAAYKHTKRYIHTIILNSLEQVNGLTSHLFIVQRKKFRVRQKVIFSVQVSVQLHCL